MTCIVGLVHAESVYIGADSAAVGRFVCRATTVPKVFIKDSFLIAYTGSFRMGQVLQHHLSVKAQEASQSDMEFMVTEFVEAVRTLLKSRGVAEVQHNRESGGQFLVGYRGRLFSVGSDYHVGEIAERMDALGVGVTALGEDVGTREGIHALGVGAAFALGAMKALPRMGPEKRIRKSLEIAAHYTMGVRPPFHVERLSPP